MVVASGHIGTIVFLTWVSNQLWGYPAWAHPPRVEDAVEKAKQEGDEGAWGSTLVSFGSCNNLKVHQQQVNPRLMLLKLAYLSTWACGH